MDHYRYMPTATGQSDDNRPPANLHQVAPLPAHLAWLPCQSPATMAA